jgi:hypothetical protein
MELMVVNTYVVSSKTVYPSLPRQRDLIQVIARTTATDNTAKDVAILLTDETFYLHVRVHHCRRALQVWLLHAAWLQTQCRRTPPNRSSTVAGLCARVGDQVAAAARMAR